MGNKSNGLRDPLARNQLWYLGERSCREYGNGKSRAGISPVVRKVRIGLSYLVCLSDHLFFAVPEQIGFTSVQTNPALPPRNKPTIPSRFRQPLGPIITDTVGTGSKRVYLDIKSSPPDVAYPPRPVPGSVADLDVIMEHCDFSEGKVCHLYSHGDSVLKFPLAVRS